MGADVSMTRTQKLCAFFSTSFPVSEMVTPTWLAFVEIGLRSWGVDRDMCPEIWDTLTPMMLRAKLFNERFANHACADLGGRM